MDSIAVLTESFSRVPQLARRAVHGLTNDQLAWVPAEGANPIAWLAWHLARAQDAQVDDVAGTEQVYVTGDWGPRFGLASDAADTGYRHSADAVRAVCPESAQVLLDYLAAVHEATLRYLSTISEADLDRVIDESWDPHVTLGVRLVSIIDDDVQHAGQAACVRGLQDV